VVQRREKVKKKKTEEILVLDDSISTDEEEVEEREAKVAKKTTTKKKNKPTTPAAKKTIKRTVNTQNILDVLNSNLQNTNLGFDFGASASRFSVALKNDVKPIPSDESILTCVIVEPKTVEDFEIIQIDKGTVYTDIQKSNIVYHLKEKIGIQINSKFYGDLKFTNEEGATFRYEPKKIFQRVISKFFGDAIDQNTYIQDALGPDSTILVSHPNNYSVSQVFEFKNLIKKQLKEDIEVWDGDIQAYPESECSLFSFIKERSEYEKGTFLIIDQGDSTTNISIADIKDKIHIKSDGNNSGGMAITEILIAHFEKDPNSKKSKNTTTAIRLEAENLKSILLNPKKDDETFCTSVNGKEYEIDRKEFQKDCEACYKITDQLVARNLNGQKIDTVLFTGGSCNNFYLRDYLMKHSLKGIKNPPVYQHAKTRVVEGLHYIHTLQNYKLIIETSPHSIYTMVKNKKKRT